MNKILDGIIATVKTNKKIVIIAGSVLAAIIILFVVLGGKGSSPDFLNTINELHESSYVADGAITISDKNLQINLNKNESDVSINASCGENEYQDLYTKAGNTIYINTEAIETQSGLMAITTTDSEDAVSIQSVIVNALSNCEQIVFETDGESQKMLINTTEAWAEVWQAIYDALQENTDAIAAGYSTPDVVKSQIKTALIDIKKLAETTTIANTLEVSIVPTEGKYTVHFDMTVDMSILPSFAKIEDIDSNKMKLSGNIIFTVTEGATIKKPSGAIHAMTAAGTDDFLTKFWNSMFEKGKYVSFNQVSVTNDTVSLTRKLGETTEICQLVFGGDGVTNAAWYITSPNEELLKAYVSKYQTSKSSGDDKNYIITELDDGTYSLSISVSDNGLNSFNKIAKTPKAMGEYLNSAKGGEIIV